MSKCIPLYPYPILIIESSHGDKYIVIADLHIGFEDHIINKGIYINPKQSVDELLELITKTIKKTNIRNLIILGDLKSSVRVINKTEWTYIPYFIKSLSQICNIFLIPGNHDGNIINLLSKDTNLMSIKGIEIEDILLIHGHTSPKIKNGVRRVIMGHLHPSLNKEGRLLNGQRIWIYIRMIRNIQQKENLEIIIMPKFNNIINEQYSVFYKGVNYRKRSKLPLLHKLLFKNNWQIDNAFCYSLNGDIIGNEQDVEKILF